MTDRDKAWSQQNLCRAKRLDPCVKRRLLAHGPEVKEGERIMRPTQSPDVFTGRSGKHLMVSEAHVRAMHCVVCLLLLLQVNLRIGDIQESWPKTIIMVMQAIGIDKVVCNFNIELWKR